MYTLGEAAKATGKSKATISKALKSGKLSYESKTSAGYQINAAELFRVYPKPQETVESERLETPSETGEIALLKLKLEHAEKERDSLEDQLGDMKEQRDKWEREAATKGRLLEHHTTKKGWFSRFGKKTSKDIED